jgi:hypothetical protein
MSDKQQVLETLARRWMGNSAPTQAQFDGLIWALATDDELRGQFNAAVDAERKTIEDLIADDEFNVYEE